MHRCESWTIKKAENQRIDAFEMWCWRRLFRVPWTARRSNQSIQNKINPECSFEGVMLKLNEAPILSPPDAKSLLITKTVGGKYWRQEEKGTIADEMVGWHHRLNGPEFKQMLGDGEGQGSLACCSPWGPKESNTNEQLNNSNISCLLLGKISFQFCAIFFRLLLFFFTDS